jgi:hypothetical protein
VDSIINIVLGKVRVILGDEFVGMFLHGSLAIGDFSYESSDIDYVVVTRNAVSEKQFIALQDMHNQLQSLESKWPQELEASYIPKQAIRLYDPPNTVHPRIERGETLVIKSHDSEWVIKRHVIRELGIVVSGPSPQTLIDPVQPEDLRRAIIDFMWWWELQISDTSNIEQSGFQAYTILTMCRILYTLNHATVVSKPVAAHWAIEVLGERWRELINRALIWRSCRAEVDQLVEAKAFIQFTLRRSAKSGASL